MDASGFDEERIVLCFAPSARSCLVSASGWLLLVASLVGIGLPFLIARLLAVRARRYVLTNRKLEVESGWFAKHRDAIELKNVATVALHGTPLGARMGIGDIALTLDQQAALIWLPGIGAARRVADTLRATVMLARLTRGPDDARTAVKPST